MNKKCSFNHKLHFFLYYRTHRDIAYYADQLCVTPKYLSETCKSISGCGAAYWINRYIRQNLGISASEIRGGDK